MGKVASNKEVIAEMIARGFCPGHADFKQEIKDEIKIVNDKIIDFWNLVEEKWRNIITESEKTTITHMLDLKGMITAFITNNTKQFNEFNNEFIDIKLSIKNINKRITQIEDQINNLFNKE